MSGHIRVVGTQGLWCALRQIYFPQLFAFVGENSDDTNLPIQRLYTLDPSANAREGTKIVPITHIDSRGVAGRRTKSLVLRHHETLQTAREYLNGVEDFTNTCDLAEVFACKAGYFTLLLRATKSEWADPLIFYVAERYGEEGIQRFEVAVGPDGEARPMDLLGTD